LCIITNLEFNTPGSANADPPETWQLLLGVLIRLGELVFDDRYQQKQKNDFGQNYKNLGHYMEFVSTDFVNIIFSKPIQSSFGCWRLRLEALEAVVQYFSALFLVHRDTTREVPVIRVSFKIQPQCCPAILTAALASCQGCWRPCTRNPRSGRVSCRSALSPCGSTPPLTLS
jgi:hypothetical protein